ncbi:OmpA family protein [Flavihumibacter petaseus]|uniref:OmpA family protein n=1 Tax=Flavihumibacter petaseus NBRC 106054 TaxID=1220578 RepID=A0A0E9MYJ9_9BACT|nr:OmpA family protein [Flavihumibacter petaseus]GAO42583.1 OmpA family protein [Flavihumibacter petaseus NBRC 106054]
MKKILLSAALMAAFHLSHAQVSFDYLRAADAYYRKGDYASAAEYYEKYLQGNGKGKKTQYDPYSVQSLSKNQQLQLSSRQQSVYRLAEAYRLLHYPAKAAPYYEQAITFDPAAYPLAGFHYANTLKALSQFDAAEKQYQAFLDSYKKDDGYTRAAKRELQNIVFLKEQLRRKDTVLYTLDKANFNAPGASYAPVWINDQTLWFTSTRKEEAAAKDGHTNRVYQAAFQNNTASGVSRVDLPQGKGIEQGAVSITPDGQTIFLTRWSDNGNKKAAGIFSSRKEGSGWSEPVSIGDQINTPGGNSQQPVVTPDGRFLIYSSDRSGGQGGFDLWYTPLDKGKTGTPVNMGSVINTAGDEQAPYFHAASNTLVFASNGRVGLGGFDLYTSQGGFEQWNEPKNLGYPVNSVKDDMYFASRGDAKNMLADVLLSSDRASECCFDLFVLHKKLPLKNIRGQVRDCGDQRPLGGVALAVVGADNKTIVTHRTDGEGRYSFELEEWQALTLQSSIAGYQAGSLQFGKGLPEDQLDLDNPVLCLNRIPDVGGKTVVNNMYYELNKANILDESRPALDDLARTLADSPNLVVEISGHTDNTGSPVYNQQLSERRARNVKAYLVSKGIDSSRISTVGYGDTQPVEPNVNADGSDNAEGRQKNRRTEMKVLKK